MMGPALADAPDQVHLTHGFYLEYAPTIPWPQGNATPYNTPGFQRLVELCAWMGVNCAPPGAGASPRALLDRFPFSNSTDGEITIIPLPELGDVEELELLPNIDPDFEITELTPDASPQTGPDEEVLLAPGISSEDLEAAADPFAQIAQQWLNQMEQWANDARNTPSASDAVTLNDILGEEFFDRLGALPWAQFQSRPHTAPRPVPHSFGHGFLVIPQTITPQYVNPRFDVPHGFGFPRSPFPQGSGFPWPTF